MSYGTPYVSRDGAGLRPPRSKSYNCDQQAGTGHYMGYSPWAGDGIPHGLYEAADHNRCATMWRGIQDDHMSDPGAADIYYSSGVCPHGWRFEGRGPDVRHGANGDDYGNYSTFATCYIAGLGDELTDQAKFAFLDEAERFGHPFRYPHNYWFATGCPGDPVENWIAEGTPAPNGVPPTEEDMIVKQIAWTHEGSNWAESVGLPQWQSCAIMLYESGIATYIEDPESLEFMHDMKVPDLGRIGDHVFKTYTYAEAKIS